MLDEQSVLSLLRKENERLKSLLREHGIPYDKEANSYPDSGMTTVENLPFSADCSKAGMMFMPCDGNRKKANPATRQRARMSGKQESV